MLTRDFDLKVKGLQDSGTFTGYASTYGNTDHQGDVIEPGAFKQSIQQQGAGYPLLWSHKQDEPIGIGRVEDSQNGLVVHGSLLLADPTAAKVHAHLKMGSIRGLSIGFLVPKGEGKATYRNDGTRVLKEVHLKEVSLVAIPANPQAQVVTVKSLADVRLVLKDLREAGEDEAELVEIGRELLRLLPDREPKRKSGPDAEALSMLQAFASELERVQAGLRM